MLHGAGVGQRFSGRGDVGGTAAAGSLAVEELVIEGFEGGDGAADDEAGELRAVYMENGGGQSWGFKAWAGWRWGEKEGENVRIAYAVHAKRSKVAPVRRGINVWESL